MRTRALLIVIAGVMLSDAVGAVSAEGESKFADKPQHVGSQAEMDKLEAAIAPYIATAKSTYPAVKDRFAKGLPAGSVLFITTRLHDGTLVESVFTRVLALTGTTVTARIANDLRTVKNHRKGEQITFDEGELVDWTIVDRAGDEEGNVVGKFLDTYKP